MSSTESLYLVFASTGFAVGFGHCIGMCGPIVVSMSLHLKEGAFILPHLLYNGGRLTTYAVLGGIIGFAGSFTMIAGSIASVQKGVMIFAGIVVIAMSLAMAGWAPLGRLGFLFKNMETLNRPLSRIFRRLSASNSRLAYYPLGLILGLLPCGPVYTALVAAARAGMEAEEAFAGAFCGAGLMAAFGIGTVPALLLVAKIAGLGWIKSRAMVYKVGAILMIGVGVYFVVKGLRY